MSGTDIDDINTYGGLVTDYRAVPDPTVERPAAQANKAYMAVAEMTGTVVRAMVSFTGIASSPATVTYHYARWGGAAGVLPVVTRTGTGVYVVTWPATIVDAAGVTKSINLRTGWGNVEGATHGVARCERTTANSFTVRVYNASGSASDLVGSTITVFAV